MAVTWTIARQKKDGSWSDPQTFDAIFCTEATRRLQNQGPDTCTLTFSGMRPPSIGGLKVGEIIRILRQDGDAAPVGWFTGRVISPERSAAGGSESARVELQGPWWYLQQIVYRQLGLFYLSAGAGAGSGATIPTGEADPFNLSSDPAAALTSIVLLNQAEQNGVPVDAGTMLGNALAYARSVGARFVVGQAAINQVIPAEELRDPTCADVVKRVLRWLPDFAFWWDYTVDPPAAMIQPRSARPAVTLTMGGDAPQVEKASLQSRPDLVLPGVALQFMRRLTLTASVPTTTTAEDGTVTTATTTTSMEVNSLEFDVAGPDPYGIGALVATVELTGGTVGTDGTAGTTFEPTPQGLAQFIYDARKTLQFSGSVSLHGQDVIDGGNWLGKTLNIAGGDDEWTGMAAQVQTAEESTSKGTTSLTVGPPDQLGPSDLAALLQANRLRQYVNSTDALVRSGGGATLPPSNPPPPPAATPPGNLHFGDPKPDVPDDDDGSGPETETGLGFAGSCRLYSGSTTTPLVDHGPNHTGVGGSYYNTPITNAPDAGSPPFAGSYQDAGPASGFSYSNAGNALSSVGFRPDGSGFNSNGDGWFTYTTWSGSYTQGTLDLSAYPYLSFVYAELRGSVTYTLKDGTSKTEAFQIPVTQYLGQKTPNYRLYPLGKAAVYDYLLHSDSESHLTSHAKSESAVISTLFVKGRGKPATKPRG